MRTGYDLNNKSLTLDEMEHAPSVTSTLNNYLGFERDWTYPPNEPSATVQPALVAGPLTFGVTLLEGRPLSNILSQMRAPRSSSTSTLINSIYLSLGTRYLKFRFPSIDDSGPEHDDQQMDMYFQI